MNAPLQLARFSLDDTRSVEGYDLGSTWNGWACPTFTRAQLPALIATLSAEGMSPKFDGESLSIVSPGCGDEIETFDMHTHPSMSEPVWSVGAFGWCWYKDDETDASKEETARAALAAFVKAAEELERAWSPVLDTGYPLKKKSFDEVVCDLQAWKRVNDGGAA